MVSRKFVTYPELPDYGIPRFSRKHLIDLQRCGLFPCALQISASRIGWEEDAILSWVASRPVARSVRPAVEAEPVGLRREPAAPSGHDGGPALADENSGPAPVRLRRTR